MRKLFIYIAVAALTFFIGISFLFFSIQFGSFSNTENHTTISNLSGTVDESKVSKPTGNELKVEIQKLDNNSFKAKVTNISAKKVFCFFVPKSSDGIFGLHHFLEKRKSNSDEFEFFRGQDSLPPASPIFPNQSIEFQFFAFKKGEYRVNIPYLIDENIANLYQRKSPFEFTEVEKEQEVKSRATFITQSVIITKKK